VCIFHKQGAATSTASSSARSCSKYGGPLIDPGYVLSVIIASLKDAEEGSNRIEVIKIELVQLKTELWYLAVLSSRVIILRVDAKY
jgi:hypothetical protein